MRSSSSGALHTEQLGSDVVSDARRIGSVSSRMAANDRRRSEASVVPSPISRRLDTNVMSFPTSIRFEWSARERTIRHEESDRLSDVPQMTSRSLGSVSPKVGRYRSWRRTTDRNND